MQRIRIQPASPKEDPFKLPYPYFIEAKGKVGRQDFWKGEPYMLIGFTEMEKAGGGDGDISFDMFWKNPKLCIGMYPIFAHKSGEWFTYKDKIASIDITD